MKIFSLSAFVCLSALFAGCGRKETVSGTGTNFQSSFKRADAPIREFAEQAVEAENKSDYSTAFRHFRALSLNPELSPEQRNFSTESMLKMGAKLREAANNGDKEAKDMLEEYHESK